MDKIFLDTNILLDFLAARSPFDVEAKILFNRAQTGQIQLFASVLSICNIAYILRKISPSADVPQILANLSTLVTLTPVDDQIISDALQSSFTDFEDSVQHFSAFHFGGITHLVTRNQSDYQHSLIPVVTPNDYLLANP